MSSIAHGMKKRMSKATTRGKTIEAGMSAAYTAEKHTIQREKKALEKALKLVEGGKSAWMQVSNAQKEFNDLVATEASVDGKVYPVATEMVASTRALQTDMVATEGVDAPVTRLVGHVKAYMAEMEAVEKEFKDVETSFTEVTRYEKKVGKLTAKAEKKKDKGVEKTKRNLDKLAGERTVHEAKVDAIVERMKKTSSKFETVLQCAQTAFWLAQDKFAVTVDKHTSTMRAQAAGVRDELVAFDVSKGAEEAVPDVGPDAPTEMPAPPTKDDVAPAAPKPVVA